MACRLYDDDDDDDDVDDDDDAGGGAGGDPHKYINISYGLGQEDGYESWFSRWVRVQKSRADSILFFVWSHEPATFSLDHRPITKDPARPDLGGDRPIDMASEEASRAPADEWWNPGKGVFQQSSRGKRW